MEILLWIGVCLFAWNAWVFSGGIVAYNVFRISDEVEADDLLIITFFTWPWWCVKMLWNKIKGGIE